jgi:hypothetical protein
VARDYCKRCRGTGVFNCRMCTACKGSGKQQLALPDPPPGSVIIPVAPVRFLCHDHLDQLRFPLRAALDVLARPEDPHSI